MANDNETLNDADHPRSHPRSSIFGDRLAFTSPLVQVNLLVELPFWLMVDDCQLLYLSGLRRSQ